MREIIRVYEDQVLVDLVAACRQTIPNRGFSLYRSGLNTLPSRFPRRASATGSKIERCPRASADKLLVYLGGQARACRISGKSTNLPSHVHGLADVVRPDAARVRLEFMTLL